jgi:hypothetical protein
MPTHQQIDRFTLAFHRKALERLREDPSLVREAVAVLDRWEAQGMSEHGQSYRDVWRVLLESPVSMIEARICVDSDAAATLRSVSPLGFLLDEPERLRIRREAMSA